MQVTPGQFSCYNLAGIRGYLISYIPPMTASNILKLMMYIHCAYDTQNNQNFPQIQSQDWLGEPRSDGW